MRDELVPDQGDIFGWIEQVFHFGIRRPAYAADRKAEDLVESQFRQMGLENVRREPVTLPRWEPLNCSLTVRTVGQTFSVPCFPLPHASPTNGMELPLALFDPDRPEDVAGRAALHAMALMEIPPDLPAGNPEIAAALHEELVVGLSTGGVSLDPRGTFAGATQILPFSPLLQSVMEGAIQAGAAAFIGVLTNHPGDSCEYYVPYDGVERPIPGVWIRGSDGARLQALLADGDVSIRLVVESTRETVTSWNIVAELPGADEELLVIGSHHDGPWASAVEDASGIALVLAQAAYWSQVPRGQRPHRLLFLLNAGHMVGGAGCDAFIARHRSQLEDIVLEIHLEHAAGEFRRQGGELLPTGEPEPRWFFTSRNTDLRHALLSSLQAEAVDRALIIAPDTFGDQPTTDGGAFHPAGVPLVNFLTAPFYLFDAMDTLDKIHRESLVPITRAIIRLIESTAGVSARSMRAGMVSD